MGSAFRHCRRETAVPCSRCRCAVRPWGRAHHFHVPAAPNEAALSGCCRRHNSSLERRNVSKLFKDLNNEAAIVARSQDDL